MGCNVWELRSGGFEFLGLLKVALMLRLFVEYGCCSGSDRERGGGVVNIVVVIIGDVSMSVLRRERSARHASNGCAFCVVNSTHLYMYLAPWVCTLELPKGIVSCYLVPVLPLVVRIQVP